MKIIRIVKCVHPIDDIIKNIFENLPQMRTWNKYDITGVRSIYIKKKKCISNFFKKMQYYSYNNRYIHNPLDPLPTNGNILKTVIE